MDEPRIDKVVVVCPNEACKQKLAVPLSSQILNVTCPKCGTHFTFSGKGHSDASPPTEGQRTRPTTVSQKRPWVRWLARTIDILFGYLLFGIALVFVYPDGIDLPDVIVAMGFLFAWVFVEALLLASFGSTPGKWLLNTRVIAQDGENPSFPKALRRSLGVWWRGLGLGLPLIGLITQISSYSKLKEDGITPWDRAAGLMVTHRKVGFPRMLFTLLILGGVVYLIALAYQYEPLSAEEQLRELLADAEGEIHLPHVPREALALFWKDLANRTFGQPNATKRSLTTEEVTRHCREAIVSVTATDSSGRPLAEGGGVLINPAGALLTNRHVVRDAHGLSVTSESGWACQRWCLLADLNDIDIVVLFPIDAPPQPLPVIPMGNSEALEQGETIIAIGNPLGLKLTVSQGIISALREVSTPEQTQFLQITAAISPGSSGGALLNKYGELVGITQGLFSGESAQNLNFAVPTCEILRRIERAAEASGHRP